MVYLLPGETSLQDFSDIAVAGSSQSEQTPSGGESSVTAATGSSDGEVSGPVLWEGPLSEGSSSEEAQGAVAESRLTGLHGTYLDYDAPTTSTGGAPLVRWEAQGGFAKKKVAAFQQALHEEGSDQTGSLVARGGFLKKLAAVGRGYLLLHSARADLQPSRAQRLSQASSRRVPLRLYRRQRRALLRALGWRHRMQSRKQQLRSTSHPRGPLETGEGISRQVVSRQVVLPSAPELPQRAEPDSSSDDSSSSEDDFFALPEAAPGFPKRVSSLPRLELRKPVAKVNMFFRAPLVSEPSSETVVGQPDAGVRHFVSTLLHRGCIIAAYWLAGNYSCTHPAFKGICFVTGQST